MNGPSVVKKKKGLRIAISGGFSSENGKSCVPARKKQGIAHPFPLPSPSTTS